MTKRRGVTLLETVVAMLLLTIITGSAFTVCSSAATSVGTTVKDFDALVDCENIVTCFKTADDKADFETLLGACGYGEYSYEQNADGADEANTSTLVFVFGRHGCKVTAKLTKDGLPLSDGSLLGATITITAVSLLETKTMYTTSYTKGGGND